MITKMPREQAERQLHSMIETLRHESFYESGTWIDETMRVYVGWVARKNSFCSGMPLRNQTGSVVLAFSGEEFPEPEVARRLREQGHHLEGGRSSYLPYVYEQDAAFPATLNGRFHGLVADRDQEKVTLFNDRYAMHRLYFHESNDGFYFSAEAKAILAVRSEVRSVDAQGLGEFIACGCVLENRTIFQGVGVLPPASAWIFRRGAIEERNTYFHSQEWESQTTLDPKSYYEQLRSTFSRNLPRYFDGPEPIGISVTGGLDTRMIMAWHAAESGSLPCYTFGSMYRDCRDVTVGRKVARVWKQKHQVIPVASDFLSRFANYAERTVYLSDGSVEVTRAPDLYVNEVARQIAPVRVVGTYGSEVLRSVRPRIHKGQKWATSFKPSEPPPGLFSTEVLSHIRAASDTYAGALQGHPVSFAVFRQAPWHQYGVLGLEQTQLGVRTPFLDNDFVRTVFCAPESALTNSDISLRLIADGNPALARILTDRGLGGDQTQLSTRAFHNFLEFTFKAEYAYDYGMPQRVAQVDHMFSALHFERLFLGRHKFYHFRVWYRDALSNYVREMLLDPRSLSRPYLQRKGLENIVSGHLKGNRNFTTEIHKVLTLELMHRLFLDA